MDSKLAAIIYEQLAARAQETGLGNHEAAGDFTNAGFAMAAAYDPDGKDGWAVCWVTRKNGIPIGNRREVRFKWRDYVTEPSKLTDLLLDEYSKLKV